MDTEMQVKQAPRPRMPARLHMQAKSPTSSKHHLAISKTRSFASKFHSGGMAAAQVRLHGRLNCAVCVYSPEWLH